MIFAGSAHSSGAHTVSTRKKRAQLELRAPSNERTPIRDVLYPAGSGVLNVSLKARMARKEIAAAAMIMKAGL